MREAQASLENYWATFLRGRSRAPYVHPDDDQYLASIGWWKKHPHLREELTFEKYVQSRRFEEPRSSEFHFSLQPMPYAGDLSNAVVYILLLNPGFAHNDYYAEYRDAEYRRRLDRNLAQDFTRVDFPFFYLDPIFCWTAGFRWWEGKLRRVVEALAQARFRSRYRDALRFTAQRLASIELVPYHSNAFKDGGFLQLPSASVARIAVAQIARSIRDRGACVVVTRQVSAWGLSGLPDEVVCYGGAEARAAHLTPESRGGRIILDRLTAAALI